MMRSKNPLNAGTLAEIARIPVPDSDRTALLSSTSR